MNSFTTKSPQGINLLELILSIALCGMALLAVVGVQWRHHKALQKDEVRLEARAVASSILDQLEVDLRTDFDAVYAIGLGPVSSDLDPQGRFQYLIQEQYEDLEGNLKKEQVEIHWESPQGPRKEVLWCVYLRGE